jgi:hypothetical protein
MRPGIRTAGLIISGILAAGLALLLIGELVTQAQEGRRVFSEPKDLLPSLGLFILVGVAGGALILQPIAAVCGGITLILAILLSYLYPDTVLPLFDHGDWFFRWINGINATGSQILAGVWLGTGALGFARRFQVRRATRPSASPPDGTGSRSPATEPTRVTPPQATEEG